MKQYNLVLRSISVLICLTVFIFSSRQESEPNTPLIDGKCSLIDSLIKDSKYILGLDTSYSSRDAIRKMIRIYDKDNYFECNYNKHLNNGLKVNTTREIGLDFNTGNYREIAFIEIREMREGLMAFEFLSYEFGCQESMVDVYGITYYVKINDGNQMSFESRTVSLGHF